MVPGHEIVGSGRGGGACGAPPRRRASASASAGSAAPASSASGACPARRTCARRKRSPPASARPGGFAERIRVDGALRVSDPRRAALGARGAAPLRRRDGLRAAARASRGPSLRVGGGGDRRPRAPRAAVRARDGLRGDGAVRRTPPRRAEALGVRRAPLRGARASSKALRTAAQSLDFVLSTAFLAQDWKGLLRDAAPERRAGAWVGAPDESLRLDVGGMLGRQLSVTTQRDRRAPGRARDARLRRAPRDRSRRSSCGCSRRPTPASRPCAGARRRYASCWRPDRPAFRPYAHIKAE